MNSVDLGYSLIFEAMIFPCGKFVAPGIWLFANNAELRTSSSTKPGAPPFSASWISQQSVSNLNCRSKCAIASSQRAAGICVTAFGIGTSFNMACNRLPLSRGGIACTIGGKANQRSNHAKALQRTKTAQFSGCGLGLRRLVRFRVFVRGRDFRTGEARDGAGLVPLRGLFHHRPRRERP